jgi:hypothetical protein
MLDKIGEKHGTRLAHGTYRTMKVRLSAIFTEARDLGLYDGTNPTTGVRTPKDESMAADASLTVSTRS